MSEFKPFIAPEAKVRELTWVGLLMGSALGVLFALSSVYLGLKVGLTVSASIPVAVLSITLFRWLRLRATILENNIVQTTGSAGESLAAGVAFTLPSLLIMGFELEFMRVLLVALLGGLIGVLMMIPLRHGLIVKEHGHLAYPEGTACADVLIVGERGGTDAKTVFIGFFVGLFYTFMNLINRLWSDTATFAIDFWGRLKGAVMAFEVSPPMLGVGYIIGPKVSANMLAGGLLAFVILIPLIHTFGDSDVDADVPGDDEDHRADERVPDPVELHPVHRRRRRRDGRLHRPGARDPDHRLGVPRRARQPAGRQGPGQRSSWRARSRTSR
jgi:putative OPT family oligopeptide transporter